MTSPTRSTHLSPQPAPAGSGHDAGRRNPPRSPPVLMNPPVRQSHLDMLFETLFSSDEDELPPHDDADSYVHADFGILFDAYRRPPPECSDAWLPCLPPLARELHEMSRAGQAIDVMLGHAAELLRQGMEVTAVDARYGRSVLHWSCMLAHAELAAWLLRNGAAEQVNHLDHQGQSPLACIQAHRSLPGGAQLIDTLLSAGARLDALPYRGAELLYRRDLPVSLVRRLLQADVDVDGGGAFDSTPLVSGCGSVNWGAASLLLEFDADVLRRGPFGMSVLHNPRLPIWLAEQCHRRGADVNATDMLGETPLMLACAEGSLPLVRWLVSKGARLDAVADDGRTVAEYAASGGPEVAAWLARHGAHVSAASSGDLPTS